MTPRERVNRMASPTPGVRTWNDVQFDIEQMLLDAESDAFLRGARKALEEIAKRVDDIGGRWTRADLVDFLRALAANNDERLAALLEKKA